MKKKLMSCLVVLAFMFSIAVPSGFAQNTSANGISNSGFTMSIAKEEKLTSDNANDPEVTKVTSKITAVYNYAGGVLISVGDANRGITLISNGKAFASLSYNFESGTYSFASINLDGLDYDKVKEAGGLKNFLKSLGIPESALQTQQPLLDEKGAPLNITAGMSDETVQKLTGNKYKSVADYEAREATDVSWLGIAEKALSEGISSGISINFAAEGGASLTTMKNGQPLATYSAQYTTDKNGNQVPFKSAQYTYQNGFLKSVTNYSFEVDYMNLFGEDKEDKEKGEKLQAYVKNMEKWLANHPGKTAEDYGKTISDSDKGKEAYNEYLKKEKAGGITFKSSETTTHYNKYGQAAYVEKDGKTIQQFNYAHNGSLVTSKDLTTGTTTNYVGGKVHQVLNEEGFIVNQYNYNNNGTINEVVTYNDGTATQRTAFLYGKALATADLSNGNVTADEIRKGYAEITNLNSSDMNAYQKIVDQYNFKQVMAYSGHLANGGFMKFLLSCDGKTSNEEFNAAITAMSYNNGISPIASASFDFGTKNYEREDSISIDGNTFKTEYDENGNVKKDKNGMELTARNKAKQHMYNTMSKSQREAQLKDDKGKSIYKDGKFVDGKGIEDISIEQSTDESKSAHRVKVSGTMMECRTLTVSTSVNSYGQAAFSLSSTMEFDHHSTGKDFTRDLGGYSDPAVIGVVKNFVDANGNVIEDVDAYLRDNPDAKVYAKVSAEGVNMMDGSGFKAADGEDIFVEVSAEQANEINVGEKAMFMGDVSKSSEGKYIMRTNENYTVTVNGKEYKGMVTGKDLAAAKAEIQNESAKAMNGESKYAWMNDNTKNNRNLFNLGSGNYLNDWKQGWDILRANLS